MYILGLLAFHQVLLLPLSVYSYESHNIPCRVTEKEGSASPANLRPQYSLKVTQKHLQECVNFTP